MARWGAILFAVACRAASVRADAQPREVAPVGRLLVTSRVGGHFVDPSCRPSTGSRHLEPAPYARYAQALRAEMSGSQDPLLMDTGGLLAPHGVARFAAQHAPDTLARLVDEIGYQALTLGESELSAPRRPILETGRALRDRDIPLIATNLFCGPQAESLCDVVVDGRDGVSIHTLGSERIAIISVLSPDILRRVAPERAEDVRLASPAETVERAIAAARDHGATVTVAVAALGSGPEASARTMELARQLAPDAKPDMMIAAGAGDQMLFARPASFRPAVMAAPPGGAARVRVRRNLLVETFDVLARPVAPADQPHPAIERFIHRVGREYCRRWGGWLPGGRLDRPLGRLDMVGLAAGAMRRSASAEVAFLDHQVLDRSWTGGEFEALTASDVYVALAYDEPLVRAEVSGQWLQKVAQLDRGKLLAQGLEVSEGGVDVNGRPLVPRGTYDVVTVRLLALGGPRGLPPGPDWKPIPGATLRSALLRYLADPGQGDPRDRLPDPAQQAEWTFRIDSDGTFSGTHIDNPGDQFNETQLQRDDTTTVGVRLALRADGLTPQWGWENVFETDYRLTRTVGGGTNESNDLLSLRSTLRWRGLRVDRPYFYVPQPFVEGYFESEYTTPGERDFRHFLIRPTTGFQFTFNQYLSFRTTAGFEVEALDPDGEVLPGVGLQLVLKRWPLMQAGGREIALEGNLDYFVSDLGDTHRQTLRASLDSSFDLFGPLAVGWSIDMFVITQDDRPVGINSTAEVFLRISWLGRTLGL